MRNLLKASLVTWMGAGALMTATVIRGKVFAVLLGPSGVGTLSQLLGFVTLAGLVGSLSLGSGVAQSIARYVGERDGDRQRRVVQTSVAIAAGIGCVLMIAVFAAAPTVSRWLFDGDATHAFEIRLLAAGVPFMSLGPLFQAIFSGYGLPRVSAISDLVTGAATVGFGAFFAVLWGLPGAAVAVALIHAARVLTQWLGLRMSRGDVLRDFPGAVDAQAVRTIAPALLGVAAASIVMTVSDAASQLFLRTQIIRYYGVEANGLYQAAFAASNQLLVNGVLFVSGYGFAQVNSAVTAEERTARTNQVLHLVLIITLLGVAALVLLRFVYIRVFLSEPFMPGARYFAVQATGEALKQIGLAIGMPVLLVAGPRIWMLVGLIWGVSTAVLAVILVPFGDWSLAWPYLLTNALYLTATWVVMARKDGFRMEKHNRHCLVLGLLMVPLLASLPANWWALLLGAGIAVGWAWFALGQYRSQVVEWISRQRVKA